LSVERTPATFVFEAAPSGDWLAGAAGGSVWAAELSCDDCGSAAGGCSGAGGCSAGATSFGSVVGSAVAEVVVVVVVVVSAGAADSLVGSIN
jgi:hypothetical protein